MEGNELKAVVWGTLFVFGIAAGGMYGCPQYNIYVQRSAGEARLREAESSRKILIQEAEAKKESARFLAEAEIERARGVAEANRIIGEGLKGHEEYLRYLWIMSLEHAQDSTVVYVPTESNLPVLEASRLQAKPAK